MAMTDDVAANVATAERLVRDAAAQGAQDRPDPRAVRGSVLLQGPAARALRPGAAARRPPDGRALRGGRRRARRRAAAERLRARRPGAVQHRRRWSTPTAPCSAPTARATSPTAPATPRSTTSAPATPASGSGATRTATIGVGICWDQWFPESARCDGAAGRRGAALPDGDRQRAARPDVGLERPLAAGDAGPCRREPDAGRRRQPHRSRRSAGRARSRSTARRSSPTTPAPRSPRPAATARPCSSRRSIATSCGRSARRGVCSATAAPSSTARWSRSTARRGIGPGPG